MTAQRFRDSGCTRAPTARRSELHPCWRKYVLNRAGDAIEPDTDSAYLRTGQRVRDASSSAACRLVALPGYWRTQASTDSHGVLRRCAVHGRDEPVRRRAHARASCLSSNDESVGEVALVLAKQHVGHVLDRPFRITVDSSAQDDHYTTSRRYLALPLPRRCHIAASWSDQVAMLGAHTSTSVDCQSSLTRMNNIFPNLP